MSSLAELPELAGFFSYSREDDEAFKGTLSALRDGIQRELSAQLGKRTFRLWQDLEAIAPGKLWESEIKTAIDGSFFFIPIVTPRSVGSKYCKFEFESFLAREKEIGRSDLVFPILCISVSALENEAGRPEAEAKLRTEQGQAFAAAIEPHKAWPISPAFLKDWLENKQSARVTAGVAVLAVLLLIGVGGYAFLRHSVEGAVQRAELKWEEEHKTVEGRKQTEAETRTRYSALLSQGTTDAKINANDKAIATFSEAIRLDPGAAAAFYERGKAYRNKSNYDRAIADYNEAIRLDPKNASALSERCGAAYYISDFDKAIADCNEAIRLDPKNADTFVNRGLVFARIGDHERAMTDYNEALSLFYSAALVMRTKATTTGPLPMTTRPSDSIPTLLTPL
jgi:tetratricopeptide (TPR) repeat protein